LLLPTFRLPEAKAPPKRRGGPNTDAFRLI
jgi:hypothetical protein